MVAIDDLYTRKDKSHVSSRAGTTATKFLITGHPRVVGHPDFASSRSTAAAAATSAGWRPVLVGIQTGADDHLAQRLPG